MLCKSGLLAIAAAATFGTMLLTPTSSDASPGFHRAGGGGSHAGRPGRVIDPGYGRPGRHGHLRPRWPHRPHWHGHRHRHVWYTPPVVYAAAPVITTNRCTCLTKEYTQEGAVLFKDNCTNEMAMNPPVQAQPPQQTGAVQQPQMQYAQPQQQYTPQYPPQTQTR